jgi:hypothetical protein
MAEEIDYEKILSKLQEDRADLDRMIAWVKGKLAKSDPLEHPTVDSLIQKRPDDPVRSPRFKSDTFFKMSVQQAIARCLALAKRPLTAREITGALETGGLTHKAKDLYQTVFPTLMRMKDKGEVDKLADGGWGLSAWYDRKTQQPSAEEGK